MITLYGKTDCSYTEKVIDALDAYGLSFIKKNIKNPVIKEELVRLGGKGQVPYLIDGETALYESEAIIAYIEETYGARTGVASVIPHHGGAPDVCSIL